ncbi:hypothetical protein EHP00_740 [Ecytonucleospora hepatopenaei]|uniref:Uncharacterized protein n=1 Tax=Ecytonucleospora hepatopenaei TaxID=646526 RepID=A0A1W0E3B0_9MICR|nr:hypothetical protein EHP00_740 [Ecytonucleospora hepatopenaei]
MSFNVFSDFHELCEDFKYKRNVNFKKVFYFIFLLLLMSLCVYCIIILITGVVKFIYYFFSILRRERNKSGQSYSEMQRNQNTQNNMIYIHSKPNNKNTEPYEIL